MIRFGTFKDLTRLEQIPFGLPFVLAGAFLARSLPSFQWRGAFFVIPCFLFARISGMAFNQLIDRHFDAKNPRTQKRVLPTGRATVGEVASIAWLALTVFIVFAFSVNRVTALLTPVAALLLLLYSYLKRFHACCHAVLGAIHFLGPVMAYAACSNTISLSALCLGGAAASLIMGSDIIYAIQDYDFDRETRLFSLPAVLGIKTGLNVALITHLVTLQFLLSAGVCGELPFRYYTVIPTAALFFSLFHIRVRKSLQAIQRPFFLCNVATSCAVLFFIVWSGL